MHLFSYLLYREECPFSFSAEIIFHIGQVTYFFQFCAIPKELFTKLCLRAGDSSLTAPLALHFLKGRIWDGTKSSVSEQRKGYFLFAPMTDCFFSVLVTLNVLKETNWQNNCEGTVTHLRARGCPLCSEPWGNAGAREFGLLVTDRHMRRTCNHIKNSSKHPGLCF